MGASQIFRILLTHRSKKIFVKNQPKNNFVLPEQFLQRLTAIVGLSLFHEVEKTFAARPTSFRVNTLKTARPLVLDALEQNGFKVRNVPWYRDAFILQNKSKRELMELDIYKNGWIYIQSLASMVPPLALDPKPGEKVFDLTAAPGSKTSQIAALMGGVGQLVANDNNKARFFKLKHNLELLGVVDKENFLLLRLEDGSKLCREYPNYFDKILLDAPCSAEARFIADEPKTYGYWSERKIKEMAYKQRKLLLSAWSALKPGGVLVYSTCTFAPEENEMQISRLLERYVEAAEVETIDLPGIKMLQPLKDWKGKFFHPETAKARRIYPTNEIEGFFIAKIRKREQ